MGEHEDGASRVRPDPGEGEEVLQRRRQLATKPLDAGDRDVVQRPGPAGVAETLPCGDDGAWPRRRARSRGRKHGKERRPTIEHPTNLGLLQHDLGDEDRPRVPDHPPRQVTLVPGEPLEQSRAELLDADVETCVIEQT